MHRNKQTYYPLALRNVGDLAPPSNTYTYLQGSETIVSILAISVLSKIKGLIAIHLFNERLKF